MELISKNDLIRYIKCWCIGEGIGHDQKTFLRAIQDQEIVEAVPLSMIDDIKAAIEELIKTYERNYGKDLGMIFGLKNAIDIIDEKLKEYKE